MSRLQWWRKGCLALCLVASPAHAREVDPHAFEKREIAYQVLNAIDAVQTIAATQDGGGEEGNPLFGRHPSVGKIIGMKLGFGVVHYLIAKRLNDADPVDGARRFQTISLIIQGGIVGANLRFAF